MFPSSFFLSKVGSELFKGSKYDRKIFFLFSWQFFIPRFVYSLLGIEIEYIILHDQCIRHITRFAIEKKWISQETGSYLNKINTASAYLLVEKMMTSGSINSLSVGELTLVSLCVRHHVRDAPSSSPSSSHFVSSHFVSSHFVSSHFVSSHFVSSHPPSSSPSTILKYIIDLIEKKTSEISSINSQNKMTLRSNNTDIGDTFIRMDYIEDPELFEYVSNKMKNFSSTPSSVVLLLSGGIDSMTLAHIFEKISRETSGENTIDFRFLHFDWKKRLESTREANELKNYFRNFSIPLNVIECPIDKNDPQWDDKTTQFRFQTLQQISGDIQTEGIGHRNVIFVTGHVIEDLAENLFMNTLFNNSKGFNFTQIFGMKEYGIVRGVKMFKPLLLHRKPKEMVSHLSDNASNLDVKRRAIRRNISDFDVNRIQMMYHQCSEINEYFENPKILTFQNIEFIPVFLLQQCLISNKIFKSLKNCEHIKKIILKQKRIPFEIKITDLICTCTSEGYFHWNIHTLSR